MPSNQGIMDNAHYRFSNPPEAGTARHSVQVCTLNRESKFKLPEAAAQT
jgi:hypothetical protein